MKLKDVARPILTSSLSNRKIAFTTGLSHTTISKYRKIFEDKNYEWPTIQEMSDSEVEAILRGTRKSCVNKVVPDWALIYKEMQKPNMTLQLLWEEYCQENPGAAYGFSSFCYKFVKYKRKLDISMRQSHRAGECVFVDFAGTTIPYLDPDTNEDHDAQIFVGVMGCSNYTFSCAVKSQSIADWVEAHNKMFLYYGGVPEIVVPDNLKSAVIKAGKDHVINRTYQELCKHYGIVAFPTRVRKPKDKAKAEVGVLIITRWILVKLRNRKFFSIDEINEAIIELLWQVNERPFKKLPGCRRSRFEELDKPLLKPHPGKIFEYAEWTRSQKVGPDYHVYIKEHYYSVPHELVSEHVEARVTNKTLEILSNGRRVASHLRSFVVGGHTTLPEHQPNSHRHFADQTPERLLEWARNIGESAELAVKFQFESRPHTMLGLKACSTLRRLAKDYGTERFEAACKRAELIGSLTVKSIRSILQRGLTELTDEHAPIQVNLPFHNNVRGSSYYTDGGR